MMKSPKRLLAANEERYNLFRQIRHAQTIRSDRNMQINNMSN